MIARAKQNRHGALKVKATFAMSILLATVFAAEGDANSTASSDTEDYYGVPKSDWDFAIYEQPDTGYPRYAEGRGFRAYFGAGSNAASLIRFENAESEWLSLSLRPLTNGSSRLESVRSVQAHARDTTATYSGAWGSNTVLSYEVGLTGLKETISIGTRPTTEGDLLATSVLEFDQDVLTPRIGGQNLTGYAHWKGPIEFVNATGVPRFSIPQAFVKDDRPPQGTEPSVVWLEYQVERLGGNLTLSAVVPESYLADPDLRWPITIDPTIELPENYYEEHAYSDCDIEMDSSLHMFYGSSLSLDHCTMAFNGPYEFRVDPGAALALNDSVVFSSGADHDYSFYANGTIDITNSTISDTYGGIQVASYEHVVVVASNIEDTVGDGVVVRTAPSVLLVNDTTIRNASGAGIRFEVNGQGTGFVNNTRVLNSGAGLVLVQTNVGLVADNIAVTNVSGAAVWLDHSQAAVQHVAVRSAREAFRVENSSINAGNSTAIDVVTGITCVDGSIYLDEVIILRVVAIGFNGTNCAATWLDGNYYAWSRSLASSTIEVHHRLDVQLLNATDAPLPNTNVALYNLTGVQDGSVATTDANGWARGMIVHEFFLATSGAYTFFTPHKIVAIVTNNPFVHSFLGGRRALTIHAGPDFDADGLANVQENDFNNVTWIEAEYRMRADGQAFGDTYASADVAIRGASNGQYLSESDWPFLANGTYELLLRVAGNGLGTSMSVNLTLPNGSLLLATESHELTEDYTWVSTRQFSLPTSDRVAVNVTATVPANSTSLPNEALLVDKLAFIRVKNSTGIPVNSTHGFRTDPLEVDTDRDGLKDGLEATQARGWYEAEVLAAAAPLLASPLAASGRAIMHPQGTLVVLNADLEGFVVTPSAGYQVYFRALSLTGGSANASVTGSCGGSCFASGVFSVGPNWEWIAGPTVTAPANPGAFHVLLTDFDDPNNADGTNYLAIDTIAVFAISSLNTQSGWFNVSSPMDPDMDRDGLPDGAELEGYFAADVVQAENYTSSSSVTTTEGGVIFSNGVSWANYTVSVRYSGQYRFLLTPLLVITSGPPGVPYDTLKDLLVAEVRDSSQTPVAPITSGMPAVNYTNLSTTDSGGNTQIGAFYEGRFNLTVGNYSIKLSINATKAAQLWPRAFSMSMDSFFLQKFRLNTTRWDADGDLVPDGYEINGSMLPLRSDSDYDVIDDYEEIHFGVDGYVTSPISNDTDVDGLLDGLEVGLVADVDPSSRTDPTNADSDRDGVPDGWVDGWFFSQEARRFVSDRTWRDGFPQPWEGEDLNGDGTVDNTTFAWGESFESVGGESDPSLWDTDNDSMDDGWELFPRAGAFFLNPLSDDGASDNDNDTLENWAEYSVRTNPFSNDTDADWIEDGEEATIALRTSVAAGLLNSSAYASVTLSDWVYYRANPFDGGPGVVYSFSNASWNLSADSGFAANRTLWLHTLQDGALVVFNATLEVIGVWDFDADPFDANDNGVLDGVVYLFSANETMEAVSSTSPVFGYRGRELVGPVNPLLQDTDRDGVVDGNEGQFFSGCCAEWQADYDHDGKPAAADSDADGDDIPDRLENRNGDKVFDPAAGETAPFAADTDGDTIPDGIDTGPLDMDNDGLTGFYARSCDQWGWECELDQFDGMEWHQAGHYTGIATPDTDGDGLLDGEEDGNHNGLYDAFEADPLDRDTDDDGLWDGPLMRNNASNITIPVASVAASRNVGLPYGGGPEILSFLRMPWYEDEAYVNYTLSNLTAAQYIVSVQVTKDGPADNETRLISVRIDGAAWWRKPTVLSTIQPNWTNITLGHILVNSTGAHTLTVAADIGGFLLVRLTLTPVNLSEQWFGSRPRVADSDEDTLGDGAEVGLTNATVTNDPGAATNVSRLDPNESGFWSNPTIRDTDGDGLMDGTLVRDGKWLGESDHGTRPAAADSDGDHLSDFTEALFTLSSPLDADSDDDGLPDSYEPMPTWDSDDDNATAVWDFDTDNNDTNPANLTSDYGSNKDAPTLALGLTVVFRTNATRGEFWRERTWIAVNLTHGQALDPFVFDANITNLSSYAPVNFTTHVAPDGFGSSIQPWYNYSITTFEGLTVLANATHVAIRVNGSFGYRFRAWTPSDPGGLALDPWLSIHNATSSSNFRYRETINWSAIYVNLDGDGDGLGIAKEIQLGTNVSDPDTDHDNLDDGSEYYGVFIRAAGRTFFGQPLVNDSDGDGLSDGLEITGWGNSVASDPQQNDTDRDGAWDGNFTIGPEGMPNPTTWSLGEWQNKTNPLVQDTDNDGVPDGWELTFGLNASDPLDAPIDTDFDAASNWQEYYWGQNETNVSWDGLNDAWNESVNGTWWNGTNPRVLDGDNDSMPDGWEMVFDLDPRNVSDKEQDPDHDALVNYREYNLSIIDASWNQSRAWDPFLSADPYLNDTDWDGMDDYYELNTTFKRDFDGDGIPSGVDEDSDGDGLDDWIEVHGWEIGVLNASSASEFFNRPDKDDMSAFWWFNQSSDPFDIDTDGDGVRDDGEFANFSNASDTDTDRDGVADPYDHVWDPESHAYVSLSTVQDLEGPELFGFPWSYTTGACYGSLPGVPLTFQIACVNITIAIHDPNGVANVTFTGLGTGIPTGWEGAWLGSFAAANEEHTWAWGWVVVPLAGPSEFRGQFQILVQAWDKLGNVNSSVLLGGEIHEKWRRELSKIDVVGMEIVRDKGACDLAIGPLHLTLVGPQCIYAWASEWGHKFGFDMAAQGAKAGFQDTFTTYSSVYAPDPPQAPCDLNCQLSKMTELAIAKAKELDEWKRAGHPWECDDAQSLDLEGWQEFAHAVGPGLNPFEPTFDDLVNLSSEIGTVNLYCHVNYNLTNASNYAIWLAGYFDGSKQGGATFGLIMLVVDVVTFIIGLPALYSMGKAIVGLLKAGWEALKKAPAALAKLQVFLIQKARAFATAVTDLGTAIAEKSGAILKQVGGSLARAADAARAVTRDIGRFRQLLGQPVPITDAGVLSKLTEEQLLAAIARMGALGEKFAGEVRDLKGVLKAGAMEHAGGKGGTRAGIALQKHSAREGSWLEGEAPTGNFAANAKRAEAIIDDLLEHGTMTTRVDDVFGEIVSVRYSNGAGAWWRADGRFIGFLEP